MITYLIKSTICLGLLFAIYRFFLEKEKMHQFNRFYLLGILLFSVIVPSFIYIETAESSPINALAVATVNSFSIQDYSEYIIIIYGSIVFLFLARFIRNIMVMMTKISKNEKIKEEYATIVLVDENVLPHTFMHYIFINKTDYVKQNIEKELFTHELTHVTEKHSLDIMYIELFQAIFWFNPIFRLINKSIRLNHEFIADDTVINTHKNVANYQHILLDIATWNNTNCLTSNLNYSLTKKRFQMMLKRSSRVTKLITQISLIPICALLIFLFANTITGQESKVEEHSDTTVERFDEHRHDDERDIHTSFKEESEEHSEETHRERAHHN